MVKVSMNEKDYSSGNFMGEGTHVVKITGAVLDKLDDGREYIQVGVENEAGQDAEVRLWLHTEGAAKFTLRTLQGIVTHNAKTEAEKDKVRTFFIGEFDNKKIQGVIDKLEGKKCWYTNEKSDRTYTAADGTIKHSYDRNITGYEPAPRKITAEEHGKKVMGEEITKENADEVFPF